MRTADGLNGVSVGGARGLWRYEDAPRYPQAAGQPAHRGTRCGGAAGETDGIAHVASAMRTILAPMPGPAVQYRKGCILPAIHEVGLPTLRRKLGCGPLSPAQSRRIPGFPSQWLRPLRVENQLDAISCNNRGVSAFWLRARLRPRLVTERKYVIEIRRAGQVGETSGCERAC